MGKAGKKEHEGVSRRGFLGGTAATSLGVALGLRSTINEAIPPSTGRRPNFVLVNIDDMRYDLLGSEDHPYLETPHLDRMAAEGMRFTRAYVTTPICGPSRAGLMTGLMPEQHGTRLNEDAVNKSRFYPEGPFLPREIKAAGYKTAWIGKTHMGPSGPRPEFDYWFVRHGVPWPADFDHSDRQAARAFYRKMVHTHARYNVNGRIVDIEKYHCDLMFDEGVHYVLDAKEVPFFLYIAPFAIHSPYLPAPRHAGRYEGKGIPPRPNRDWDAFSEADRKQLVSRYEKQCEMMLAVDEGVGRIMEALEEAGVAQDSYFLFTSDNGFLFGEHGLRGKNHPWEESIRVPLVAWAPGRVPAGIVSDTLVSHADYLPTAIDLMGGKIPEACYGRSIKGVLHGEKSHMRETVMLQRFGAEGEAADKWDWFALMDPDHKYIRLLDRPGERLFRLRDDPYEMNDLSGHETAKLQELSEVMDTQLKENEAKFQKWLRV